MSQHKEFKKLIGGVGRYAVPLSLCVAASCVFVACGTLRDILKLDVPPDMQGPGIPAQVSLREAPRAWAQYELTVRQTGERFSEEADRKEMLYSFISSIGLDTAKMGADAATGAGLPLLGSLLLAGAALFTDKPGTKARFDKVYAKGVADAKNGSA